MRTLVPVHNRYIGSHQYFIDSQDKWDVFTDTHINDSGDLIDRDSLSKPEEQRKVLVHCSDVITDENLNTTDYFNDNIVNG